MDKGKLEQRLLDVTKKHGLSHLSSCLTTLPIIEHIYDNIKDGDHFVLSNGHAGLALYVILEQKYGINAEELFLKHGIHPNRDLSNKIEVSTGSLGCGILIGVGMALGDKNNNTYVIISDGECMEGSVWEALRFAYEQKLDNLKIYVNANGFSAYKKIDICYLERSLRTLNPNINFIDTSHIYKKYPTLKGEISDHYEKLK